MSGLSHFIQSIEALNAVPGTSIGEEDARVIIDGLSLTEAIANQIRTLKEQYDQTFNLGLVLRVAGDQESFDFDEFQESCQRCVGKPWKLVFGKSGLLKDSCARENECKLAFLSVAGFCEWLKKRDPFHLPFVAEPTSIWIAGLPRPVGGPSLWIFPLGEAPSAPCPEDGFPDQKGVFALIHVGGFDRSPHINPKNICLTWGDRDSIAAQEIIKLGTLILASCLVQELNKVADGYEVVLRGTRRLALKLTPPETTPSSAFISMLQETVVWVYKERPETRLKLVMDRLSIDLEEGTSFLAGLESQLGLALQQAKDSYAFVILERKDSYHKEMRELMKDMKSQADLFASKVRDLVSSLSRDILGVLVFFGFSFLGKFDTSKLHQLIASPELSLLTKVLAGYLALSWLLQIATHFRDAQLALEESTSWLKVLQNYTSAKDKEDRFLTPIGKRKRTLYFAMVIVSAIYVVLVCVTWNLPDIASCLLQTKP